MVDSIGMDGFRFTAEELVELDKSIDAIEIQGQRLPDAVAAFGKGGAAETMKKLVSRARAMSLS